MKLQSSWRAVLRAPVTISLALLLMAAHPPSSIERGAAIAAHGTSSGALPCMACHGAQLHGNPAIGAPALAGLDPAVTRSALRAIAEGKRGKNYVMKKIARSLTRSQRRAVSAYLASLPPG